jgi:hypothetical protein
VYYSNDGSNNFHFVSAMVTNYTHTSQNYGRYHSPYFYHTVIEETATDCTVAYAPVLKQSSSTGKQNNNDGDFGESFRSLRIPPLASAFGGDVNQDMKLALVGDLGQTQNSIQTMQHLMEEKDEVAALLLMGDLSYADNDNPRWDEWSTMFEHVLDQIPLQSLPGNHEIEKDTSDGVSFRPYAHRFPMMPNCKNNCGGFDNEGWEANMWHSFDIGSAHVIHVSSYHQYDHQSPQYLWLAQDLQQIDRAKTPWVIVNMYAPWYNSNVAHQNEFQSIEIRKAWQPLLCQHRVNLMFFGHVHSYERIHPTCDNSTVNAMQGISYINIGDGGNREGIYNDWLPGENGRAGPVWSAFREGSYGHGVLHLMNATHAFWAWHRNNDGDKVTRDTVMVENFAYYDVLKAKEEEEASQEDLQVINKIVNNFFDVRVSAAPLVVLVLLVAYSVVMTVMYVRKGRRNMKSDSYNRLWEQERELQSFNKGSSKDLEL